MVELKVGWLDTMMVVLKVQQLVVGLVERLVAEMADQLAVMKVALMVDGWVGQLADLKDMQKVYWWVQMMDTMSEQKMALLKTVL
jgi:hypothetical protein